MSSSPSENRVVFTGGGTGGHVYPALAIADSLLARPGWRGIYIGVPGKAEERILRTRAEGPGVPLPFKRAMSRGFPGLRKPAIVPFLIVLCLGVIQACWHLLRFRPILIVATGGYASAPALLAASLLKRARLLRIRIMVHEQNATLGMFNRVASRLADLVALTFPLSDPVPLPAGSRVTGYPVRAGLGELPDRESSCRALGLDPGKPVAFVFGGSTGARSINRALYSILPGLLDEGIQVIHGHGMANSPEYHAVAEHEEQIARITKHFHEAGREGLLETMYHARTYFDDIRPAYAAADLVVGRGGAGTLFELLQVGRPLLVIPKMGLPGDHQVANALGARRRGAVDVLLEEVRPAGEGFEIVVPGEALQARISALLADRERRERLTAAAGTMASPHALESLVGLALDLVAGRATSEELPAGNEPESRGIEGATTQELVARCLTSPLDSEERAYAEYRAMAALASSSWQERNSGVKLCGALRLDRALPALCHLMEHGGRPGRLARLLGERHGQNGFIRRNLAHALSRFQLRPQLVGLLDRLLKDPYWEARIAALRSLSTLGAEPTAGSLAAARDMLRGNFEERMAVADWWSSCLQARDWKLWIRPLLDDGNCRVREAALSAIGTSIGRGDLELDAELECLLEETMLTSTYFHPLFPLKQARRDVATSEGEQAC